MFHHKGRYTGLLAAALLAPALYAFEPCRAGYHVESIQIPTPARCSATCRSRSAKFTDEEATGRCAACNTAQAFSATCRSDTTTTWSWSWCRNGHDCLPISFNGMRAVRAPRPFTKSLAQVGFGEGRIFDQSMLERAEYELKEQYLAKGKYGVRSHRDGHRCRATGWASASTCSKASGQDPPRNPRGRQQGLLGAICSTSST